MALEMVAGDIVQVSILGELDLQRCMTVMHWRYKTGSTAEEYFASLDALKAVLFPATGGMFGAYLQCLVIDYSVDMIQMQKIFAGRFRQKTYQDGGPWFGVVDEAQLPPATQVSITKQGALANRHGIGGVRMPGVPFSFASEGRLSPTAITTYGGFADYLNNTISISSGKVWEPIIFNRAAPAESQVTISLLVQETIRTMSRRVLGRGI